MSWSLVAPQRDIPGGKTFPSVRYSACALAYRGEMVVTHGYFYNHALRHPAWQSDAWAFNFGTQRWRKLHEGERAGAPSARYSATAVLYDHALWMYGGDDGGHKKSMFNYIFQAWFDELWRFDLRTYVWHKVSYNSAAPSKRALHSAVVVDKSMYVYGGLELADTWRYDFEPSTWTLLIATPADGDETHPGRRHAFAAASATASGFYIYGGCRHVKGMRPQAFNDLWYYSIGSNAWSKLAPSAGLPTPSPRSHLSLVALSTTKVLLYGGALCIPGCTCHGDSWVWDTSSKQWSELNTTDAPIHRYRQSLVVHQQEGAVYLYGGESYRPYMYHNAVNRLKLPAAIARQMIAESGGGAVPSSSGLVGPAAASSALRVATLDARDALASSMNDLTGSVRQGIASAASVPSGSIFGAVGLTTVAPVALALLGLVVCAVRARRQQKPRYNYKAVGGA